jgi:hypothetical protein
MSDASKEGRQDAEWEAHVQEMGQQMKFPPTPDIAGAVRKQLSQNPRVWRMPIYAKVAAALVAIIVVIMLAVPDIRAAAWDFFRIGSVEFDNTSPTIDTGKRLDSVLDLPNESTLTLAQSQFDFVIPPALGEPDRVFVPMQGLVVLVWAEPDITSLFIIKSETLIKKYYPEAIQFVEVNGKEGAWLEGEHILEFPPGQEKPIERVVTGNVLIWQFDDELTYRLEGNFTLEEAIELAESLP